MVVKEIIYWKNNIKVIDKRAVKEYKIPSLLVCSVANLGLASVYIAKGKANICHKRFFQIKTNLRVHVERTRSYAILT